MKPEQDIAGLFNNSEILDHSKDLLGKSLENLKNNEALKHIGIFGEGFKLLKGSLLVYHYLFTRKVLSFAAGFSKVDSKKKEKFLKKLERPAYSKKVGITILEIIEKTSTAYKAQIIGSLFAEHVAGNMSFSTFKTCAEMVNNAYVSDLEYFLINGYREEIDETGAEIEHLISLGYLYRNMSKFGDTVLSSLYVKLTPHGHSILRALSDIDRRLGRLE